MFESLNKVFLIYLLFIHSFGKGLVESQFLWSILDKYKNIKSASKDRDSEIEILMGVPKETPSLWMNLRTNPRSYAQGPQSGRSG